MCLIMWVWLRSTTTLGFFSSQISDKVGLHRALKWNPIRLGNCEFILRQWVDCYPEIDKNYRDRIWVNFSRVPFYYWTIKGIFLLGKSIGTPIAFVNDTFNAAIANEPLVSAKVLVELGSLETVPSFVMVNNFITECKSKVLVSCDWNSCCKGCLATSHSGVCPSVRELFSIDDCEEDLVKASPCEAYNVIDSDSSYRDAISERDSDIESPRLLNAEGRDDSDNIDMSDAMDASYPEDDEDNVALSAGDTLVFSS